MAEERVQRRLAAILAADVAGYSRLMELDEERTHRAFQTCHARIAELVLRHGGRVFGGAGDSMMIEFASPVGAVRAGLEIQSELAGLSLDLPADRRMLFRIGINVGDVMADGLGLVGTASTSLRGFRPWPTPAASAYLKACASSWEARFV
jgi:class 3 adenylate cyclase